MVWMKRSYFSEFKSFIGDNYLVAHNAAFDLGFLRTVWERNGLKTLK
ncbi:hypothetical protein KHA80_06480 [Anaerobacillus sp. HL2]|nr:hypothetical protein KHA80_06480 [Anaerobacillus sp. HL2]